MEPRDAEAQQSAGARAPSRFGLSSATQLSPQDVTSAPPASRNPASSSRSTARLTSSAAHASSRGDRGKAPDRPPPANAVWEAAALFDTSLKPARHSSSSSSSSKATTSSDNTATVRSKSRLPYPLKGKLAERHPPKDAEGSADAASSSGSHAALLYQSNPPAHAGRPGQRRTLVRRGSHPPHQPVSAQSQNDDGEFIKRAFDNLSFSEAGARPAFAPGAANDDPPTVQSSGSGSSAGQVSLLEMLSNDDPLGVGVSIRRVATKNTSRSSLSSSISPPASALSVADRTSMHSAVPLLHQRTSSAVGGPSASVSNRHSRHSTSSDAADPETWDDFRLDGTTRLLGSSPPWTDPFAEGDARLRRRSTISGYSVGSSDWLSLRRGSLASLENGNGNGRAGQVGNGPSAGGEHNPFSERTGSLRWEQWAQAYRDTMLQHMQTGAHQGPAEAERNLAGTSALPTSRLLRPHRNPSFADTISSASSIHEHPNLFYPLRRQFLARSGSRGEGNRILIIELCHALEEFFSALTGLWESCRLDAGSDRSVPSYSPPGEGQPASARRTRKSLEQLEATEEGDDVESTINKLQLLAGEVDSLVREVVEAVPAFSYALGQGNYGPLPFPVTDRSVIHEELDVRTYLEEIQVIPRRERGAERPALEYEDMEAIMDVETWWPARLRVDLNEGLLQDTIESSPSINLHSFVTAMPASSSADNEMGRSASGGTPKNDELLEEGRKRWMKYKQQKQKSR